jgi:hypothetical protein
VSVPKMRAYVNAFTSQLVEAHFTFLGSTGNEARLGSGELRRQFGLKLRAQDACNLVDAMWRIEPESKLVVSVKSNPGQHTSAECGNRGYRNIKPRRSTPVPVLHSGDTHDLRAEINADEMKVFADNQIVWEGLLGQRSCRSMDRWASAQTTPVCRFNCASVLPSKQTRPGPRMQVRPRTIRIAASAAAALCGPLRGSNNGHWCHSERSLRSEEALSVLTCSLRSNEYLGADSTQELFGAAASPAPRPSSLPPLHPRCSPA